MNPQITIRLGLFIALLGGLIALAGLRAKDPEPKPGASKPEPGKTESAVKPKPLSDNVHKGLAYLVSQQHANGGWGQGGGWRTGQQGGRVEGANVQDPPDVANTCMATLALLRAGHTPKEGKYAKNVVRAVEFIETHIEKADKDSISITDIKGTQVQSKIGPFVDTFLAAMVLAEVKGQMPDDKGEKRLVAALDKTIGKMERNQKKDGSFGQDGWAPIVGQSLASAGLNRARQKGVAVSDETLARTDKFARGNFDNKTNTFGMGGTAGVPLYGAANTIAQGQQTINTFKPAQPDLKRVVESKTATKEEKTKAQNQLKVLEDAEAAQEAAVTTTVRQLGDGRFVQGFGSNGGEEFLSYMAISETLLVKGGPEWEKWDKKVTDNLNRVQNKDGSWSGDHCITGKTFCTASALLVLMADRAPIPVATKIKEKKEGKTAPDQKQPAQKEPDKKEPDKK
jgi:hypothetical protein